MQVQAESRHIEMESIEEGIVELVCQLGIRKLVMGTAAYSKYNHQTDFCFCFTIHVLTIMFFFISIYTYAKIYCHYIRFENPKGAVHLNDSHWMCVILGNFGEFCIHEWALGQDHRETEEYGILVAFKTF